jgi:hypothetical protein
MILMQGVIKISLTHSGSYSGSPISIYEVS